VTLQSTSIRGAPKYSTSVAPITSSPSGTALAPHIATAVDATGDVGAFTSITIGADALPIVSHYDVTRLDLKVAHCTNTACSSATTTAIDTIGNVGLYTSITIGDDGQPVVSYSDFINGDLKVARIKHTAWAPNGWGR
jgi:hypothetical protein